MIIIILCALICAIYAFDFRQVTVYSDTTVIATAAQYTFYFERYHDNTFSSTNWNTEDVASNANITITFPNDFTLSSPNVISVTINSVAISGFTFSSTTNIITIQSVFTSISNLSIYDAQVVVGNVLNPAPAVATGFFTATIGSDTAVPEGNGVQLTAGTFESCSVTFDQAYVNQTSTMVFTLNPKNQLTSTSTILITLPQTRQWTNDISSNTLPLANSMNCENRSASVSQSTACSGDLGAFTIEASNLFSASITDQFAFGVMNFQSPPTLQPSDLIEITSYEGSDQVDTCSVYVTNLIPNQFTSLTIQPIGGTMVVNTQVGLKFTMTLVDYIDQNDQFQITFPSDLTIAFVNVTGTFINTGSVSGQVLTVEQKTFASRQYAPSSSYIVNFYNFTAPTSTKTTDSITVTITRNGYSKMTGTGTLQADPSSLSGTVAVTASTVWANTTYSINITTQDVLSSDGMVKIIFPSTITPTKSTSCATLVGSNVVSSPTCTLSSSENSITISAMNSSSSDIGIQTLQIDVLEVINAPSTAISDSFSLSTYYTSSTDTLVAEGTIGGISATIGTISSATVSVQPSSYVVLDTTVTYTISFVSTYEIPTGGFINITIPNQITFNVGSFTSSYCKITTNSGSFTGTDCENVGNYSVKFTTVAQSAPIVAGTNISLKIQSLFTNPSDTGVVSSFSITTYSSDSATIEELSSGISVQMTTPSTMQTSSIFRDGNENSATSTYTIELSQKPAMEASSYLFVTFPSQMQLTSSIACTDLNSAPLTCSRSSNILTVELGASSINALATFGVIVSNVINPPSFKPSSGFYFLTKTSTQIASYAEYTSSQAFSNSASSSFSAVSSLFSNRVYGETSNLQITLTPSSRIIPDYIVISLASSFTISTDLSCTSFIGFTGSCTNTSSHSISLQGSLISSSMTFTITGFTTPTTDPSDYTVLNSYDSSGYLIDESRNDIQFSIECAMPCRTCQSNISSCLTCYSSISITSFIYYYSDGRSCEENCPSTTYEDTSINKCLDCNSLCKQCAQTSSNCTQCDSASSYPYLNKTGNDGTCMAGCPIYYYPDTNQYPVLCVPCISPCASCTDQTTCLSCTDGFFFHAAQCKSSCPSGTTIENNATNQCDDCDSQCAQCSGTVDSCTSCSSSAALHDGSCVTSCPSPLVINNGQCSSCDSTCDTCDTVYTNCTSCVSGSSYPYLLNNICYTNCPQYYYEDTANGICLDCSLLTTGCRDCINSSYCETCDADYVFLNNKCYDTTPTGYANISGVAEACENDCLTCEGLTTNCTSCKNLSLDGNDCVSNCIAGQVPIDRVCQSCISPCETCSNIQTNCTTCQSNLNPEVFLSGNDCLQTCPDYTYANLLNNQCTACVSPCDKCTSASQCQSCTAGNFLYNTNCDTDCPFGFIGISRVCQACTPPCEDCQNSLTKCLSCLDGYYFVSSTNDCTQDCPTGLYPNDITQQCSGCTSPCDTCNGTSTTCLSCLTGILHDYSCVSNCPDGYYELNSECVNCNTGCSKCTSASVCTGCEFGYYFYNNFCLTNCPTNAPVIDSSNNCNTCSDSNCVVCDSLDQCSSCSYPTLLHLSTCLTSCPTNYTSNGTHCYYDPVDPVDPVDPNDNSTTNQTLNQTLASSDFFPVPFSIGGTFVGIACIMSKFQYQHTFLSGALYSLWGVMELGSIGVVTYLYVNSTRVETTSSPLVGKTLVGATTYNLGFTEDYLEALIFAGAVLFMYLLSIIALIAQNCYLRGDTLFNKWLKIPSNLCAYYVVSIFGVFLTHKLKNILFCKLFNFNVFKAQLDSVQNFRIFHVFAFLSFIPSIAILYSIIKLLIAHKDSTGQAILVDQLLMAYIDIIAVVTICMIFAIFNVCKKDDYFQEQYEDGYVINKRIVQSDEIMHEAIVPMMMEDEELGGGNFGKNIYETQRKFQTYDQTLSEQTSVKLVNDISIQAAPMLHDYSNVQFYDDHSMSDLSLFKKVDKSVNVTKKEEGHQVSIQYEATEYGKNEVSIQQSQNIFDRNQASIQFNPNFNEVSVQNQIDKEDISLQYVPVQNDQSIQMSRKEEEQGIQCGPLQNNISVQYSAKPIYESRSQFLPSDDDEVTESKELAEEKNNRPFKQASELKEQLQLDIEEKMKKQREIKRQAQLARFQKSKELAVQNFSKEKTERKNSRTEDMNIEKMNELYNNDESRRDGSSLMDSNANIMVRFNKEKTSEEESEKKERVPSVKTEKQFIDMLSKRDQNNLQPNESLSFNVTKDLEEQNKSNDKFRNFVFEEQDKMMESDNQGENEETSPHRENVLLRNNVQEELPSIVDKSRSTNFRSTAIGRKPPLYPNSRVLVDSSRQIQSSRGQDEEIINRPIQSKIKGRSRPMANYKEEELDFETRTNLNNFYERKNRNSISAQYVKKKVPTQNSEESEKDEIKQNPLPLPKIQRVKSQQSQQSNDDKKYRISSKKLLLEGKKMDLQFYEDDKIQLEEEDEPKKQLPRVWKSQSRIKSSVNRQRLNEGEKPVHRQILQGDSVHGRTEKFLQKEQKKAERTKKRIEEIEVLLQRPAQRDKGYMKETYTSGEKKRKGSIEKVYMNNPKKREMN